MPGHYVVTLEDVLLAHEEALQRGGGVSGIKDKGMIQSAIGRPYQEFRDLVPYPDVVGKAGCLLHGLMNNHGFHDANKRTAWIVCNAFLYTENQALILPEDYPWYDQLAQMVEERWDVNEVCRWVSLYAQGFETEEAMMEAVEIFHG